MRILLVEDDFLIGDGIKTGLEKLGFNIDWFQDGEDGEEAYLWNDEKRRIWHFTDYIWPCLQNRNYVEK